MEETRLRAHGTTSLLLYTSLRSCWPRVSLRHEALPEERLPAHADPKLGLDTHPAYWKRKRLHVLLYCTTILLHTLFTLVPIYVHEDTPKTHTGHESLFGHLAVYYVSCHRRRRRRRRSCHEFTTVYDRYPSLRCDANTLFALTRSVGRLFDFVWSRPRLTLLLYSRRNTGALP